MATAEVFWAYGVIAGPWSPPQPVVGVDDRPVEGFSRGGVTVLANGVDADAFAAEVLQHRLEDLDTLAELARAHDRVLQIALGLTDVVPFRICTLYASREALEQMLRERESHFVSTLARLRDMTEWGVKAFVTQAEAAPEVRPASGTEYLARRRAQRERAETTIGAAEAAAAEIHSMLGARAAASTLAAPQDRRLTGRTTEMVLNGAYLVARLEVPEFRRLVEAQRGGVLELELTGPWPPYHFAG
jgi:hypothetical protein